MIRKNSKSVVGKKVEEGPAIVGRKVDNMVNLKKQREAMYNHGELRRQVPGVHRNGDDQKEL